MGALRDNEKFEERKLRAWRAYQRNKGKGQDIKPNGSNPLTYLGLSFSESGLTATLLEWVNGGWSKYIEVDGRASYQLDGAAPQYRGKAFTLDRLFPVYDWVTDDGYSNFGRWIA